MARPTLVYKGADQGEESNPHMENLIRNIPLLNKKYKPPAVWGTSGNLQTAVYSLMEKRPGLDLSSLCSDRYNVRLGDGTTVYYDVFRPTKQRETSDPSLRDVTIVLCPGLASTSLNNYVQTFVSHATDSGYRVVVLNHLGMLSGEIITTPRVWNLGSTEEYGAVVLETLRLYGPSTKLIAVGMSLGAALVCKYLGEHTNMQHYFIACLSLSQGFDLIGARGLMGSSKVKKFYYQQMTKKVQISIAKNWEVLSTHPRLREMESELSLRRNEKRTLRKSQSVSARLSTNLSTPDVSLRRISSQNFTEVRATSLLSEASITEINPESSSAENDEGYEGPDSHTPNDGTFVNEVFEATGIETLDSSGYDSLTTSDGASSTHSPGEEAVGTPTRINYSDSKAYLAQLSSYTTKSKRKSHNSPLLHKVMQTKTFKTVDELITINLTGHSCPEDYYRWSSACHYMDKIDIPTLYVNAKDDPLWAKQLLIIPARRAKSHKDTLFVMTEHGGHLGFYTKTGRASVDPYTWLERMTIQYIDALIGQIEMRQLQGQGITQSLVSLSPISSPPHSEGAGGDPQDDLTVQLNIQLRLPRCRSQYQVSVQPQQTTMSSTLGDKAMTYLLDVDLNENNLRASTKRKRSMDKSKRKSLEKQSANDSASSLKTSVEEVIV